MSGSEPVLDLHDLHKAYGRGRRRIHALRGVSLQVRRGEIFGLLGPNGAGKSTLVKILMTVVRADRAGGTMLGHTLGSKRALAAVGYLPEHHRFPRYLTGRQLLEFFGALAGVDRPTRKRRAGELLEIVGMAQAADRRVDGYSKGMLQRIGVAQALMNDPQLVVLDEPTDGVDPIGRQDIRNVLLRLRDEGRTVFLNSHLLSETELVCSRVAIMVQGNIVRLGTMTELAAHRQWYEIELPPGARAAAIAALGLDEAGKGTLASGEWVEASASPEGVLVRVGTVEPSVMQSVLDCLRAGGGTVRRMELVRPSLESLFMEAVAGQAVQP